MPYSAQATVAATRCWAQADVPGRCASRIGEQVTGGLDPNFTVNAWGGPTYLGAMACHYLDAALMIAVSAWLLNMILPPAVAAEGSTVARPARRDRAVSR